MCLVLSLTVSVELQAQEGCWPGHTVTDQDKNCDGVVDGSISYPMSAKIIEHEGLFYLACQTRCVEYYSLDTIQNLYQPFQSSEEASQYFFEITRG